MTSTVVSVLTATPFKDNGLYFHCATAVFAACTKGSSPLITFISSTDPSLPTIHCNDTFPSIPNSLAASGYSGRTCLKIFARSIGQLILTSCSCFFWPVILKGQMSVRKIVKISGILILFQPPISSRSFLNDAYLLSRQSPEFRLSLSHRHCRFPWRVEKGRGHDLRGNRVPHGLDR